MVSPPIEKRSAPPTRPRVVTPNPVLSCLPTLSNLSSPPSLVFHLATGVDFKAKRLRCREVFKGTEHDYDYDCLVIATGAQNNTFGVPGVNEVNYY